VLIRSEKGQRNLWQSSADHRLPAAFYFTEPAALLVYIHHILSWPTLANAPLGRRLLSISTTPLYLLFFGRSDYAPWVSIPISLGCHRFHLDLDETIDWPTRSRRTGLAPMVTPMVTSDMGRGLSGLGFSRNSARRDA